MIVVTTEEVVGHRIVEMKGQVFGLVVRSRGLGGNIMAGLRSLGGGEIVEYTELLADARRHAVARVGQHAAPLGGKERWMPPGPWGPPAGTRSTGWSRTRPPWERMR